MHGNTVVPAVPLAIGGGRVQNSLLSAQPGHSARSLGVRRMMCRSSSPGKGLAHKPHGHGLLSPKMGTGEARVQTHPLPHPLISGPFLSGRGFVASGQNPVWSNRRRLAYGWGPSGPNWRRLV